MNVLRAVEALRTGPDRRRSNPARRILPYRGEFSGYLRGPQRVAKCFRLFGGEDEGHFRCALAVQALHRDVGTTARASPSGTGSDEPQSGQVSFFSRAIRAAWRFCRSESRAFLATPSVYLAGTRSRYRGRVSGWA